MEIGIDREDLAITFARRALTGDADAIGNLLEILWPSLRRAAYLMVRNDQTAQDIAQDACASVFVHIASLRDASAVRAWSHRILWRIARREQRRTWLWEEVSSLGTVFPPIEEFDRASVARMDLARDVRMLPISYRAPLALAYAAGLRSAEIGQILRIPAGTVRSRMSEGLRRLRAMHDSTGSFAPRARTREAGA